MNETTGNASERRATSLGSDWDEPERKPPRRKRDWKRTVLVIGLGFLSWVATYVGLLELIEANMGDLPLIHKMVIGFSVAMLMVMVVWLLDQVFSDIGWFTRLIYVGGYVFLTLISVGFGFGFYWKVLESRGESSRSAEAAVGQVQTSLHAAVTRLTQLQTTLDTLTALSEEKASLERTKGTSCPNSKPGDGPRRQMREDDASRFKFAATFVKGRLGAVTTELAGLNGDLAKVVSADQTTFDGSGTRNAFMGSLNRRLDLTVTGFNAFRSDPQLRQIRADLNARADQVTFADTKGGSYQCPDAQLTTALKGVVRAIDELPIVDKPKIAAVEGSEAVVEAFRRLGATFAGALAFKLPPSPEQLRDLQKRAVQSVEGPTGTQARAAATGEAAGLSQRDYIPLAIAVFVDLCLLLVSIKATGSPLDRLVPKMRDAEQGPVIQILSRFNEIHRDKEIRENFEVFRHVVFDYHGDYYAAVPLNTPYRPNPRNGQQRQGYGVSDAEDLMQEAHLLVNLFASFEKERIFTRVSSPLLSTGTVQKRLRRQGSKFANAEAFRIYRFRNGAWSEIILGAVMGAARRVEAEKRRQRVEDGIFRTRGPSLGPDAADPRPFLRPLAAVGGDRRETPLPRFGMERLERATQGPESPSERSLDRAGPLPVGRGHAAGWNASPRAPFMPQVVPGPDLTEAGARRPANSNTEPLFHGSAVPGGGEPQIGVAGEVERRSSDNVVLHPAVSRPPAEDWPRGSAMSDRGFGGAISMPAEAARISERDEGSEIPSFAPHRATSTPSTVAVAATRETITYTLPASEARLPPALMAKGGQTSQAAEVIEVVGQDDGKTSPALGALPPPLRPITPPGPVDVTVERMPAAPQIMATGGDREAATAGDAERSVAASPAPHDELQSLARRFVPGAREG